MESNKKDALRILIHRLQWSGCTPCPELDGNIRAALGPDARKLPYSLELQAAESLIPPGFTCQFVEHSPNWITATISDGSETYSASASFKRMALTAAILKRLYLQRYGELPPEPYWLHHSVI